MNETDMIRQQLADERAHLREILQAIRTGTRRPPPPPDLALYVDRAAQRLLTQIEAHRRGLSAAANLPPESRAQLENLTIAAQAAATAAAQPLPPRAQRLLGVLDAWEPLDALAAKALRVAHWRQAAHLSADSIMEERQLYAAARGAARLS